MQKVMKLRRVWGAVVVAFLVVLGSLDCAAQDDEKTVREVYQAQAMGQSTQLGKTFNVTMIIQQYSTPEERQVLVDAFQKAGSQGMYNALEKMHSKGRIAVTGTLGYDISFVRKVQTADGYRIRVLTNRPIEIGEAWVNGRSMDYTLSLLEMNLSKEKNKSTGTLIPAGRLKIDKKTKELEIETFHSAPWKLQNIMDRSKE